MKRPVAASMLILISAMLVYPQKQSDKQEYELIGKVKVLRCFTVSYGFAKGTYPEKEGKPSEPMAIVFDLDGNVLFKANGCKGLTMSEPYPAYSYAPRKSYDQNGNITEYLSADTVEHSRSKTKYVRDASGRIVRSQEYDPYKLTDESSYTYHSFDDHGNWTARTITPDNPVNGRSWKTLEMRTIEYYQ